MGVMPNSVPPGTVLLKKSPSNELSLEDQEFVDAVPRASEMIEALRSLVEPDKILVKIVLGPGVENESVHTMTDICRTYGFIHFTITKPDECEFGWIGGAVEEQAVARSGLGQPPTPRNRPPCAAPTSPGRGGDTDSPPVHLRLARSRRPRYLA